jgi:hypothetical protein
VTLAKHERVDEQHEPVDQLRRQQRPDQLNAANDAEVGA